MTDKTDKVKGGNDQNYTAKQVQILRDNAPLNLEIAKSLEESVSHGWRSIIAKCKSAGIEYVSKPAPVKKPHKVTKEELVKLLAKSLDRDLTGLEKAPASAINAVINGVDHLRVLIPETPLPELGDSV